MTSISLVTKSSLFETTAHFNPSTPAKWRSVLQEIKLLYHQRQYRRCIARSSSILAGAREPVHPAHRTYILFYSALSYEAMGLYAHVYSSKKVPLLREALVGLRACLAGLPDIIPEDVFVHGVDSHHDGAILEVEENFDCGEPVYEDNWDEALIAGFRGGVVGESCKVSASLSPSPSPSPRLSTPVSAQRSRSTTPTESIVTGITEIIDKTLESSEDDPFLSDYESSYNDNVELDVELHRGNNSEERIYARSPCCENSFDRIHENKAKERHLVPSPLYVRKSPKPLSLPLTTPLEPMSNTGNGTCAPSQITLWSRCAAVSRSRPPSLPLPINIGSSIRNLNVGSRNSYSTSQTREQSLIYESSVRIGSRSTFCNPAVSSVERYNNTLRFLHAQITSTITSLDRLIHEVERAQQARSESKRNSFRRSASFWSFSPVKDKSSSSQGPATCQTEDGSFAAPSSSLSRRENIQERIVRLRAARWKSVGLRNPERGWKGSEYYKEFCGKALDELYLG